MSVQTNRVFPIQAFIDAVIQDGEKNKNHEHFLAEEKLNVILMKNNMTCDCYSVVTHVH